MKLDGSAANLSVALTLATNGEIGRNVVTQAGFMDLPEARRLQLALLNSFTFIGKFEKVSKKL